MKLILGLYSAKEIYEVGDYLETENATSPAERFGGSWEELPEGTFLMAAGSSGRAGETGGSNSVTLTKGQLPKHQLAVAWSFDPNGRDTFFNGEAVAAGGITEGAEKKGYEAYTSFVGNNEPFDNRPQYRTTHKWRKVA